MMNKTDRKENNKARTTAHTQTHRYEKKITNDESKEKVDNRGTTQRLMRVYVRMCTKKNKGRKEWTDSETKMRWDRAN